jgi:hypothetical protein
MSVAFSQSLPQPALWFKAEENSFVGKDSANLPVLLEYFGDSSLLSADKINGYPAVNIKSDSLSVGYFLLSSDVLKNTTQSLFLIVYQPYKEPNVDYDLNSLPEYGLWSLNKEDTTYLTSAHYVVGESNFRYQFKEYPGAIMTSNLLTFKTENDNIDESQFDTLLLCYSDSFYFHGKLAEFIIITQPIYENFRQVWQSYLAIKYGGTLFQGNYLNAAGDTLWYYESNQDFTFGVGGIGRDDSLLFNQNFSRIAGDSLTISLHGADNQTQILQENSNNTTYFQNGEYIFWGHNENDIVPDVSAILVQDSFYYPLERIWKIRNFTQNIYALDFMLNVQDDDVLASCDTATRLFVSSTLDFYSYQTQSYAPQAVNNGTIKFENLIFSDSVTYFTFGYNKNVIDNLDFYNSDINDLQSGEQNPLYQVFTEADWLPNPVVDNLTINYKLTRYANVWFSLHYSNGTPIYQTAPQNLSADYHQSFIPMSTLSAGIYTVYIHVDDMMAAQVIIKL